MTLTVGANLTPLRVERVSAETMSFWSQLLHDPNPIHLDREAVRVMGLGDRLINQGPANLALILAMLLRALPGAQVLSLEARYVDNLFEGDSAEASGVVTRVSTGLPPQIDCDVWLCAGGRGTVIQGVVTLSVSQPAISPEKFIVELR